MPIVSKIVRVLSKKRHSVSTRTPSLSHKIASTIAEPDYLTSISISLARPAPETKRVAAVTEGVCAGTLYRDVGTHGTMKRERQRLSDCQATPAEHLDFMLLWFRAKAPFALPPSPVGGQSGSGSTNCRRAGAPLESIPHHTGMRHTRDLTDQPWKILDHLVPKFARF